MSELSINDLPFEMLAKVFRYLDVVNLKNATLTCELWNSVIESECQWSLDYSRLWSRQKMNFALTTNRTFGTIKIERSRLNCNSRIRQIIQRHNVVKLILRECRIESLNGFADYLKASTNLEHIVVKQINLDDVSDVLLDHALPALKKLKKLEIDSSVQGIITGFQNATLRTIKIWEDMHWTQCDALVDFFSSQEMLTSLTVLIIGSSRSILTEMGKLNVPVKFRLTHLAVSSTISLHKDVDNLLRFVESQAKHLRELELGRYIPDTVFECIFSSMTKLNSLTLNISALPRVIKFYDRLEENCSVRTIKLLDVGHDDRFVANFFKKLPNIGSLTLPYRNRSSGKALEAAQCLNKLESLSTGYIDEQLINGVKFSNLKTLHIRTLRGKINWSAFTKAHPLLTELVIEEMNQLSYLTSDDIDQITTNVDLHSIRLGVGFIADDRFFEIIRTKCANLKTLDLHKSCLPDGLNYNAGINVLRLCNHFQSSKYSDFSSNFFKF